MFQDIAFLFKSPLRAKLLTYYIRQPGEWATPAEVASVVGATREAATRELHQLMRFEILISRKQGKLVSYRINEADELFVPLREFIGTVTNPTDREIVESLKGIRGIVLVVAAGLLENEVKSPLELLVVTRNADDKKIDKAVRKLETYSAVPLRYTILDEDEYHDRRQSYDRLLRDVYEYRHRTVLNRMK